MPPLKVNGISVTALRPKPAFLLTERRALKEKDKYADKGPVTILWGLAIILMAALGAVLAIANL